MSDSKRSAKGGELVALWAMLVLSIAGFAGDTVSFARQWHALDAGSVTALPPSWIIVATGLALLIAWVLAIVLAVILRRWGWLVACVLLFIAVPVFAVAMLIDGRTATSDRRRQASFEDAMARALAEEQAGRSQGEV